jgi:hypothetical protein
MKDHFVHGFGGLPAALDHVGMFFLWRVVHRVRFTLYGLRIGDSDHLPHRYLAPREARSALVLGALRFRNLWYLLDSKLEIASLLLRALVGGARRLG